MLAPIAMGSAFTAGPLIAAAGPGNGLDPWNLLGYGIGPVSVVILLLLGKLHTDVDYKRLLDWGNSEHAERKRLQDVVNERVIPMGHRQTLVMEATLPLVLAQVRLLEAREASAAAAAAGGRAE